MVNLKKYAARDICRIIGVPSVIALAAFVSMLIFSVEVTHQTECNAGGVTFLFSYLCVSFEYLLCRSQRVKPVP